MCVNPCHVTIYGSGEGVSEAMPYVGGARGSWSKHAIYGRNEGGCLRNTPFASVSHNTHMGIWEQKWSSSSHAPCTSGKTECSGKCSLCEWEKGEVQQPCPIWVVKARVSEVQRSMKKSSPNYPVNIIAPWPSCFMSIKEAVQELVTSCHGLWPFYKSSFWLSSHGNLTPDLFAHCIYCINVLHIYCTLSGRSHHCSLFAESLIFLVSCLSCS